MNHSEQIELCAKLLCGSGIEKEEIIHKLKMLCEQENRVSLRVIGQHRKYKFTNHQVFTPRGRLQGRRPKQIIYDECHGGSHE